MYRQGDVAIIPVSEFPGIVPEKGAKIDRDNGRIVLAYGEVTGHAHAISSPQAELWTMLGEDGKELPGNDNDRLLVCLDEVDLLHEEHETIKLPAGLFIIRKQREYGPEDIRTVAD